MGFAPPDWVMCGMPLPDGRVRLIASNQMTHAELSVKQDYPYVWDESPEPFTIGPITRTITLTSGMRTYVMIEADDYPAAFRALFEQWRPGPGERAAIGGQPAIGPGS